jgi:hypothetical protein
MSKIDEIRTFIKEEALKFGANNEKDYVERNNTGIEALTQGGPILVLFLQMKGIRALSMIFLLLFYQIMMINHG